MGSEGNVFRKGAFLIKISFERDVDMYSNIVITGMGAVTPVGTGVSDFWQNLIGGACGISELTRTDTSVLSVKRGGEIKNFNPKDYLSSKLVMDLEPFMQYAYVAAQEALDMSGLETDSDRVGITMGSALGGIDVIGTTQSNFLSGGKGASPKYLTKAMANICAAHFSINHKIKGPSMTVTTACSSGGDALSLAAMFIKAGMADAMVVMAGESALTETLIQSLTKVGALSKTGESRPFDRDRNGFVAAEGGGALIIETEEHAKARGAGIIARLCGCANNMDAYNPVSPNPDGSGAAACISLALADAGLSPDDIGYINAHGTATHMGDIAETNAIHKVFADRKVPVSSSKGATGHMMGAGGLIETIICVKAVETGVLPPNTGMETLDDEIDLNIVTAGNNKVQINYAMSNAMGFGGQNSCVIVGKY